MSGNRDSDHRDVGEYCAFDKARFWKTTFLPKLQPFDNDRLAGTNGLCYGQSHRIARLASAGARLLPQICQSEFRDRNNYIQLIQPASLAGPHVRIYHDPAVPFSVPKLCFWHSVETSKVWY